MSILNSILVMIVSCICLFATCIVPYIRGRWKGRKPKLHIHKHIAKFEKAMNQTNKTAGENVRLQATIQTNEQIIEICKTFTAMNDILKLHDQAINLIKGSMDRILAAHPNLQSEDTQLTQRFRKRMGQQKKVDET